MNKRDELLLRVAQAVKSISYYLSYQLAPDSEGRREFLEDATAISEAIAAFRQSRQEGKR
jgi:hypothetical protein